MSGEAARDSASPTATATPPASVSATRVARPSAERGWCPSVRRQQSRPLPEHVEHRHYWYRGCEEVRGVARVHALDNIADSDWNLNIPRYAEPPTEEEMINAVHAAATP